MGLRALAGPKVEYPWKNCELEIWESIMRIVVLVCRNWTSS